MSCAILSLRAVRAASNFTTHFICSKGAWVMELIFVLLPALVHLQCDTENCKILHLFTWAQVVWKDTWYIIFLICKFCRECGCGMHVPERPVMCKIFHVLDPMPIRHLWDEMKRLGSWWTYHRITMSFRKLWSECGMQVPQACLPSEKTCLKHHSYFFHHMGFPQNLKKICIKSFLKNKPTILCCCLARVICKLHQNSWNAKYS